MKTDLNSNIQEKLEKRSSIKKKRTNTKRVFLALNLVAAIFTTTVFSNPVSVMSEEVSAEAVQSLENSAGGDEQIAEQADAQQSPAEAVQAVEAPAAENSAEAAQAEEPSGVNAPVENALSAEMSAAEDGVVSADDGAASASAVQSAGASSASNGLFEDAGADNTDEIQDGIIEDDAEGLDKAEGTAADEAAGDAASQEQLMYENEHVKISASYTDGKAFPADSILNGTYLDSDEKNAVLSAVNTQISKDNSANTVSDPAENVENSDSAAVASTATTTVEYSTAGLHVLMLEAKNQDGSDAITEGDISFAAEFRNGLNDAGYASREETTENNEAAGDGSLTTTTTKCETLWKIYTVTEKNLTDITDITDAHNTHYEMDENGTLKSASFRGALPQTVAFVQIVKKTVTETTTQKETEKATERETDTETQKAKETEKIAGTETEQATEKTTEKTTEKVTEKTTERETDDVKEQVSSSAAMPAVTFDQKVTTDNGTVMVHVEAEEGAFEEGTSMTVTPVTSQTILDKAIDAAGGKGAAAAMDITFTKPDGTKTEPLKPIHVKMISAVLNRADEAHVVHVADSGTTDVVAKKSDGKTVERTSNDATSSDGKNAVSFESDSFSVYAIVYTVDFTFSGYTYSIKGGSSILLSFLAEKLGLHDSKQNKDFSIADVDDVTFSDSSLVEVTKKDGDWELVSKKPFTSTEKLIISMKDGSQYEVEVKDAAEKNIGGNLTDASIKINGQEVTGNTTWNVKDGNSYDITLKFEENSSSPFPNDNTWMTYKAPAGLQVEDLNTTFDMVVDGKTIRGNNLVVDKASGLIKLQWNTSDPNFKTLTDSNDVYVNVNIKASFGSNVTEVKFSDTVTRDVNVDKTHNASVKKDGYYDQSDDKIHYTVTVTSSGPSKDVVVTDTVNGTALTYDRNVTYTSTKGATATAQTKDNGFTAEIPSMSDGEEVKFTYTATVDYDKLGESGTVEQQETSNGVKITCPEDSKPEDNSATQYVNYISFSSIGKNAQSVSDEYKESGKTYRDITWNIKANEERKKHLTYIADSIAADSQNVMSYSGEGLTIVVTHENGLQEIRKVMWTDSSIEKTNTGWKYTPPASDGKASYDVTYTTKADVTNLIDSRNVSNGANTNYNSTTGNVSVGPSGENQFNASKSVAIYTENEIKWEITVNVPASGLDKLVVTDTLPSIWDGDKQQTDIDSFGEILSVDGLDGAEAYAVDSTSDPSKFTMTFYKDKAKTKPGMNQSAGNRMVTIRYTTKNNRDWLDYSMRNPYWNYLKNHTNKAVIDIPGIEKEASATATFNPSEQTVKKSGSLKETYQDSNGTTWQILEYNITLSGAADDQVLTDTFDTKHLQYFDGVRNQWYTDTSAGVIYGGTADYQGNPNDNPPKVTVTSTDTGITINTGKLPRQQDGSYYGYYRIHYYLQMKLDEMQQLSATSGGTAKFSNSVTWGAKEASADIYYPYPGVSKSCSTNGSVATYMIDVNPSALVMNEGRFMQLVDTFTNQAIDYSTIDIKATDNKGVDRSKEVTYDFSGNTGTFTIPDSTHVAITYQAKPVGKVGSNVHMTNEASMKAYHASTDMWMTVGGSASGGGDIVHLKVLKHAKDHMETKLSDAVFQLLDENGNALKYDRGGKNGLDITFTTGSDGYADIRLSASTEYSKGLEFGTTYKLREIQAPEGYQLYSSDIPFTISKDGSSDLTQNLYANGSTIAVSNKKITKVSVTLTKIDAGDVAKKLQGAFFDLYGSDYIGSDGKVNTSEKAVRQGLTTGENGTVLLGTLTGGTYYLVETKAPDGYAAEPDPITLTVSDESVTVRQGTAERKSDIKDTDTGQTANITVTDSKESKYELPSTGGPGDLPWVASGILLILLAGVVFMVRKLLIYRSKGRGGGLRS